MYGIQRIGKYNVDYAGSIYDKNIPYHMVIIEEFDRDDKPTGKRKTFYFRENRANRKTECKYLCPQFSTESEITNLMSYPEYSRFRIYKQVVFEKE